MVSIQLSYKLRILGYMVYVWNKLYLHFIAEKLNY